MVIEVKLNFKDTYVNADGEPEDLPPMEFVHTLSAPEDFEITGGQVFVENPKTRELQRFAFRVDRKDDGSADFNILEEVGL